MREIVASELERIGDERLEMVTITAVNVDGALETADVFYSALGAEEDGRSDEVAEALEEPRWKVQQVVNREVRARRTPQIRFRPDTVHDLGAADRPDPAGHRRAGRWSRRGRAASPDEDDRAGPTTGTTGRHEPARW